MSDSVYGLENIIRERDAEIARLRAEVTDLKPRLADALHQLGTTSSMFGAQVELLRAALVPFARLYGPYRYDRAPDDKVVVSNGTLGKDGDRGYCYITVADLRQAEAALGTSEQNDPFDQRPLSEADLTRTAELAQKHGWARENERDERWCIHSNLELCKFPDCECERQSSKKSSSLWPHQGTD